ncbi:MAG: hypothetical protein ACHQSE_07975 [Gemmatimonadales bacterium]
MLNLQNSQAGGAKAPPIPSMDVSPPPPVTSGREIAREVRDIARQAKIAAQDARRNAQGATPAIAAAGGQDAGHTATTAPAPYDANNLIPPQVEDISIAFFVTVAFCVVGYPLARAFARRMDRKVELKAASGPDLSPHIRQLQDSVDAMAIELERISEGQRFTAKLLADRSSVAAQNK